MNKIRNPNIEIRNNKSETSNPKPQTHLSHSSLATRPSGLVGLTNMPGQKFDRALARKFYNGGVASLAHYIVKTVGRARIDMNRRARLGLFDARQFVGRDRAVRVADMHDHRMTRVLIGKFVDLATIVGDGAINLPPACEQPCERSAPTETDRADLCRARCADIPPCRLEIVKRYVQIDLGDKLQSPLQVFR